MKLTQRMVLALALALAIGAPASAEELEKGQTELLGLVGGYSNGGGGVFGGGFQTAVAPRALVAIEAGFLPGPSGSFSFGGVSYSSKAYAIDANLHYLFPLSNEKFTPYVLGGIGFFRVSQSVNSAGYSASGSSTHVGVNLGGGARWKLGENWGLRPELKFFVANGSNVRYSLGFYFKF